MERLFYNIFIFIYSFIAGIVSPFNEKAKLWAEGRKNVFERLIKALENKSSPIIWMHCASLGEFEQGRPLIEKIKNLYPAYKILLTFFSPSGYEIRKNYALADYIFYLPVDTKKNAEKFIEIIKPDLILFIKYEFWLYYLQEAKKNKIPLLLISALFIKKQPFFKWYGNLHRSMLHSFTHLFVQNFQSANLLKEIEINNVTISGDTRFDRVLEIANNFEDIDIMKSFCNNKTVIVAGSTWTEDDEELDHFANTHLEIKFIIAPHDISAERLKECKRLYKNSMLYSEYQASGISEQQLSIHQSSVSNSNHLSHINTLIIDNIGMLSRLYKYASICYIGGAFGGAGIHNVLEAAVYYKPVVFGSEYQKSREAVELIEEGGAFDVKNALELEDVFNDLLNKKELYKKAASAAGNYVQRNAGATKKIIEFIQENRLLVN
jgi:3-deoxy-D-manno-octulosonic-acid transferase